MNILTLNSQHLKLLFLFVGLSFASCSSNDDDAVTDPDNNKNQNAYSFTLADNTYSNSWDLEEEYDDGAISSIYRENEDGDKGISMTLSDQKHEVVVSAGLSLENGQPLPLADLSDEWDIDSTASSIIIIIEGVNYISTSGTAKLSNLKTTMIIGNTGVASYKLEIDGFFDNPNTAKQEQIKVKGTFQVQSGF
ncbi:hypothetical protein ACFFU9_09095 [Mariniflexile ostreae]|uniref:Lipid/polyisoprenoid-binding YceI-like domain-containing protein n=1 Tax=Mariniflexile ostreae TaxID=1520892 RepID=A0ABV5FBR8_9FLAO